MSNTVAGYRPLSPPREEFVELPVIQKRGDTAQEINSYFEPLLYSSKLFNKDKIPTEFREISKLIKQNDTNAMRDKINHLMKLHTVLQKKEVQIELSKKGKNYIQKCLGILYVIAEYISYFYEVTLDDNGGLATVVKRTLSINDLINCFEATKKFEEVKNGHTSGSTPSLDDLKNINKLFSQENKSSLSQGGFERNSAFSRILSGEFIGILGFAIGSESLGWGSRLPITNPHIQSATALVASDLVMMAGFTVMLTSSSSIGYKFNLQKMLLEDICSEFCPSPMETNLLKTQLSFETRHELKKLLPKTWELLGPPTVIPENAQNSHTSADAERFFQQFLSANHLTYENIISGLNNIPPLDHGIYKNYLRTKAIKLNGVWGTILDHLFAKLSHDDRKLFIENINLFLPTDRQNPIKDELAGADGAINYVYNIMKKTPWNDRILGAQVLSELLLDIYSCSLIPKDKAFLLNIILSKELEGKCRGEFASGKQKKLGTKQSFGISSFYAVTSITAFIAGFFATPLAAAIIKAISNGIGAMSFGWLGLHSHIGSSCSHNSKVKFVDIGVKLFPMPAEIEPEASIQTEYDNFLACLQELKELKKNSGNYNNVVERIYGFVDYFEEQGISQFVFEANHAEKNCPLFEIVETLLDVDLLKKLVPAGERTLEEKQLVIKGIKRKALNHVSSLIARIYKKKNNEIIDKIKTPPSEMNEEIFNIFVSEGYKKATSSKAKFLFSLQCYALLDDIKKTNIPVYDNCKSIFFKAVKNAAYDKSSLLYGLQKRHEKTYTTRRVILRACADMATVGLFGVLVALSICPFTSIFGVIGMAFFTAFLYGADFAGRKLGERFEYGTRIEFGGTIIKRAYRNYEAIRSIVDIEEECDNTLHGNQNILAKVALKNIENLSLTNDFSTNKNKIMQELTPCLLDWEINLDNAKLIQSALELRNEINFILRQGFDKDSVNHSLARAQRLILSCDAVSLNEKRLLLCELSYRTCLCGQLADILQTKATWGSDQYLLADFGLGFLVGSLGIIMTIPGLHNLYQTVDAAGNISQSLSQFATQYGSQVVLDTIAFTAWIHEVDVANLGRTKSFQGALGCLKKTLSIFTPEEILREKNIALEVDISYEQRKKIEENYELANNAVKNIFKIQRDKGPSIRYAASFRNYEAQEAAVAA